MRKIILALVLGVASVTAQAQTASISLSENSAQLKYTLLVGGQSFGRNELGGGFLFNSVGDYIAEANMHVVGEAGASVPGLMLGVGAKFIGATIPSYNLMGLALGAQVAYAIPKVERLSTSLDFYYAPAIVSWLDANRISEWAFRIGYEILPQAAVYTEYRSFGADTDAATGVSFGSGFRLGVRMTF